MEETKVATATCPICGKVFDIAEDENWPTCGDPACIREARNRGLPIAVTRRKPKRAKSSKKRQPRS